MLRFRPYNPETDRILTAFRAIFHESELPYLESARAGVGSFIAVDRANEIQAFILVQETPESHAEHEISFLGVRPRYRKKGYGERLIQMALDATGTAGVWLQVNKENAVACQLYTKMGFDMTDQFVDSFGIVGTIWFYRVLYECSTCGVELLPSKTQWDASTAPFCSSCFHRDD
jgi:GNAT superfamily N-acetyltransferase/DNA-directed RNA polymerase subunit RPC12/RpoP